MLLVYLLILFVEPANLEHAGGNSSSDFRRISESTVGDMTYWSRGRKQTAARLRREGMDASIGALCVPLQLWPARPGTRRDPVQLEDLGYGRWGRDVWRDGVHACLHPDAGSWWLLDWCHPHRALRHGHPGREAGALGAGRGLAARDAEAGDAGEAVRARAAGDLQVGRPGHVRVRPAPLPAAQPGPPAAAGGLCQAGHWLSADNRACGHFVSKCFRTYDSRVSISNNKYQQSYSRPLRTTY